MDQRVQAIPATPAPRPPSAAPPGEEVVGEREGAERQLSTYTEDILREKRKAELEAICESLGLDDNGTRADLILRILKAKAKLSRK